MSREASQRSDYDVLAFVTLNKDRLLGGKPLSLLAKNEEELQILTQDLAKALKADVVQLKTGDCLIIG